MTNGFRPALKNGLTRADALGVFKFVNEFAEKYAAWEKALAQLEHRIKMLERRRRPGQTRGNVDEDSVVKKLKARLRELEDEKQWSWDELAWHAGKKDLTFEEFAQRFPGYRHYLPDGWDAV